MQKKLLVMAVAGVLSAPLVMAEAKSEFYGKLRLSVGIVGNGDTKNDDSRLSVSSHASRLGFKGSDDLAGGLKYVWQIESQIDIDDDTGEGGGLYEKMRNAYIGLTGDFGTALFGRHNTPYKMATGKLDVFTDSYADYNNVLSTAHDTRVNNAIVYVSPKMGGLTIGIAYADDAELDGDEGDNLPYKGGLNQAAVSAMATYSGGPLFVSLAVQSVEEFKAGVDVDATKIGVGYKLGDTKLGFVYEMTGTNMADTDQNNVYFSVAYNHEPECTIKFAFGQKGEVGGAAETGATFYVLGMTHELSKSTEAYALYTALDSGDSANYGLQGGVKTSDGIMGESNSAFAVGLNHKFSSL